MTSMDMRMRILANASPAEKSLQEIQNTAKGTAEGIRHAFSGIGKYIIGAVGIAGLTAGIKSAIDSAETYNSSLNLQSTIIKNQITDKKTLAQLDIKRNKYTGEYSSTYLANMQQVLSLQTSVDRSQIASAQTMLLSNKDLVGMFTTGAKYTSGIYKGMNKEFTTANLTVLNLSARMAAMMGKGGTGNPAMAAKALNKSLADPAKGLSAFARFGIELPAAEQNAIKAVETHAKGAVTSAAKLNEARHMLIQDLNKQSKGAAIAAATPMQLLANMWKILMTDFGQVFMPMLYGLKTALAGIVQPLGKVLGLLGNTLGSVMVNLGNVLGNILKAAQPLFTFLTSDVLPMLIKVFDPLMKIVVSVFTPISNVFKQMVSQSGPIGKVFTLIGNTMKGALSQVATELGAAMQQMANSGALAAIFNSIAQAFTILAPVMPELVKSLALLVVAFAPLSAKILQGMADGMVAFAKLINIIAPLLVKIVTGVTDLINKLHGVAGPLAIIAGLWFTKSLFLTPLMAAAGGVEHLVKKLGSLKQSMGILKNFAAGHGNVEKTGARLTESANAARDARLAKAAELRGRGGVKDIEKAKKLETTMSREERVAGEFERAGKMSKGRGLMGMFRGLLSGGLSGGMTFTPAAHDQLSATNNLVTALNNLNNTISTSGGMGGNNSPFSQAKKDEGLLSKVKKFGKFGAPEAEGAEALGAGEVATEAGTVAAGASETGGIMAAGAAGGLETAGISIAVAAAAAAYIKWHKAINKAVEDGAKHLWNGAKDVAKFGEKAGVDLVHGVGDVAKGVAHVAGSALHGIASFFGFGGSSTPSPMQPSTYRSAGRSMEADRLLAQLTFQTGGLLNVNIAGHTLSRPQAARLYSAIGDVPGAGLFNTRSSSLMSNASTKGLAPTDLANISRVVNAQPREVNINIADGAFQVNVQGSLDSATMPQVKGHVNDQFKELRYVLKTKGR